MLAILEVLIGLCVVFLVFSTVASVAIELIEAAVRRRARLLLRGVAEIFRMSPGGGQPNDAATTRKLLIAFYRLGPIASLYLGDVRERGAIRAGDLRGADRIRVEGGRLPSYIPASRFAGAVLDAANASPAAGATAAPSGLLAAEQADPAALSACCVRLRDLALRLYEPTASEDEKRSAQIQQQALEKLFAENAERMTGWYRSYSQVCLLIVGMLLAVLLNIDTLRIIDVLSQDEAVRARVVQVAVEQSDLLNPAPQCRRPAAADAAAAAAAAGDGTVAAAAAAAPPAAAPAATPSVTAAARDLGDADCERALREAIDARLGAVAALGLPIGWDKQAMPFWQQSRHSRLTAVLGWLMTALAISFGAPFWFDMLNRLTNLRTTLKPELSKKA